LNKDSIGHGVATGKVILMGEHSVVYGEPAIAFPFVATAISVSVTASERLELNCSYFSGHLVDVPDHLTNIRELITKIFLYLNKEVIPLSITITSTIPAERGMGSSAAVAVALTRAIFDYFDYSFTQKELLSLVNYAEKIAHGNPSGIDAAATSGKNPLFFIKGEALHTFQMNVPQAYLVVADTGIKGQTREAVADVATLLSNDPYEMNQIRSLGTLTREAKEAILLNNAPKLGAIMNKAQAILEHLTVSDQSLDILIHAARSHGALGAKLTGGGRGGCMIALADSKEQATVLSNALKQAGAKDSWIQSLEVGKK